MKKLSLVLMLVLFGIGSVFAQRTISGTITDEGGETLFGASVLVKGTSTGTVTELDGSYTVDVPEGATTLVFSYTGYETQEVEIGASNVVDVVMSEGVTLETAVVTALGVERDEKAVGFAVQQVDGDAITRSGANNALDALRGKAAGVNIIRASGAAGGGSRILIRGQTTLTGENQPLIVVDGVRIDNSNFNSENRVAGVANSNRLIDINPADIESVNVLKGAAATALYGVAGAAGVVVITTKRGRGATEKFNVSFSSNITLSEVNKLPELQSTYAQGAGGTYFGPETGASTSWGPEISTLRYNGDTDYPYDPNGALVPADDPSATSQVANAYDNLGTFFQTGIAYTNSLAISGALDKMNYRFSYSNFQEEGIVPNNTFDRNTFQLASDINLTDKITVRAKGQYTRSGGNRIQQGSNTSGLMLGLLRTSPTFDNAGGFDDPVNTEEAYRFTDGTQRNYRGGGGYDNPFWTANLTPRTDEVNRFLGSVTVDYNIDQWVNISATMGTDMYSDRRKQQFELNSRTAPSGRIFEDQYFFRNFDTYFNVTGRGNLTDDLEFGYLLGANLWGSRLNNLYTEGNGLSFNNFVHISNAAEVSSVERNFNEKNAGFYASIDFAYKGLLYLNATARQDYVSTLVVPGKDFVASEVGFFYPSVNLGFVFSELFENTDVLSFGKVRLSYAQVGGGAPDPYSTSTVFVAAAPGDGWTDGIIFPFNGVSGFTLDNQLGNPNLIPERTTTYEAGLDLRFFNGRLGLDATYYQNQSTDLIVPVDLAGTTGYTGAVLNSGDLSAQGFEIILNANPVRGKVNWDMNLNFDRNVTIVERLADGLEVLQIGGFAGTGIYHVEGQQFGQIFGGAYLRDNAGTDADDGTTIPDGNIVINDDPTSLEYGFQIPDETLRVLGNPNPDFTLGWNNTISWKDLSLSFLVDWKQGGQMWNGTQWALTFFGMAQKTADRRDDVVVFDGVKQSDGQPNDIPVNFGQNYWTSSVAGFGSVDEGFVQSTTWVRLRELSLSWNFNPKWFADSNFIEGGSLTFTGRNLYLWTPYEGVDPETSLTGANNSQGFDYFNMPGTRSYAVGLDLRF